MTPLRRFFVTRVTAMVALLALAVAAIGINRAEAAPVDAAPKTQVA